MDLNDRWQALLKEVNALHSRNELSHEVGPDYFEPGMMEYLDKSEGIYDNDRQAIMIRFEVRGTRYGDRTEQIEHVKTGDVIQVVREKDNEYNSNNFTFFTRKNKNVGNMPAELCNVIAPLFDEGYLEIISSNASYVEPISQRSRHAKQAVLFVEIKMKKTLPTNTKIKCLSCGKETDNLICDDCLTEESLDRVISEIRSKDPDKRPEIQEYISNFDNQIDAYKHIDTLLDLYPPEVSAYQYCKYYRYMHDLRFEKIARNYLDTHTEWTYKKSDILNELLRFYIPDDFEKPIPYIKEITSSDNFYIELYYDAADYYAKTGDYDLADEIINKGLKYLQDSQYNKLLNGEKAGKVYSFEKLQKLVQRYRNGKPYWPVTKERQEKIIPFYEQRLIQYDFINIAGHHRGEKQKIRKADFKPIEEYSGKTLSDYVSFWCNGVKINGPLCLCQIAGVKVRNYRIVEHFEKTVYPWDGGKAILAKAAAENDMSVDEMKEAERVTQVMENFMDFIGDDVLVSTGALGDQSEMLVRALRYALIDHIDNGFLDLLDYAADISEQFDMAHNTRDYLTNYFHLKDEKNALSKAENNVILYSRLKEME